MVDPRNNIETKDELLVSLENDISSCKEGSRQREIGVSINFWSAKKKVPT